MRKIFVNQIFCIVEPVLVMKCNTNNVNITLYFVNKIVTVKKKVPTYLMSPKIFSTLL